MERPRSDRTARISRRSFLATSLTATAACGRRVAAGFRGYAFVANEEGGAIAAVDLQALAVAKHIPLDGAPSQVVSAGPKPSVYALTPLNGSIHEIQTGTLSFARKLSAGAVATSLQMSVEGDSLYVLTREPHALACVALDIFRVVWRVALPSDPVDFSLASDGKTAAVSLASGVHLIDLPSRHMSGPLRGPSGGAGADVSASADLGVVRFLSDAKTLIVANRGGRLLSLYNVATTRLITHLPVAVRPDNLCFNQGQTPGASDGGQLFITGEGMDAVVVVYPYHTPEVAETVLAGHVPGVMAASQSFLFVASPQSGDVSILNIATRKVIAVVSVGSDPGFITVTPDDQYALVLNRKSGDVAVLRVGAIAPSRYRERSAALLTVIPVGSRPVSAAVRAV